MGLILALNQNLETHAVEQSLAAAPRILDLREAVTQVIAAVHGLPGVMDKNLRQIEVYVGRAGATAPHVRNRWVTRYEAFQRAPSAVALVVFRAPTYCVRDERWEGVAQRMIGSLTDAGALCCANALTGDSGRWPTTNECAIYIVARARKGPAGYGVDQSALDAAVRDLIHDDELGANVVRAAAREINRPDDGTAHDLYEDEEEEDEDEDEDDAEDVTCRTPDCTSRPYPGNYGYCRRHRIHLGPDEVPCKTCGRAAQAGNYGYCGRHR